MLDTISGDRIRHELELVLKEEFPEKILRRADGLGVLAKLHPSLRSDRWLEKKFGKARGFAYPNLPPRGLYLAFLTYPLTSGEIEYLISYLRLPKAIAQIIRDTASIKVKLESLADPKLAPSRIYRLLHGHAPLAIVATSFASDLPVARRHIELYLDKLRFIKPALTGDDLKRMGITPGPRIKEILQLLHEARLDGKVTSRWGEEELAKGWVA
jgi:tRNA nucleotidyltransferase (CCA-adding enzyme)